jgi:membrane protein
MPTAQEHGTDARTGVGPTLKRTAKEFQEDNLLDWAAALTYYGVLALFPALIALVSIVGLVFDPQQVTDALTQIVTELGPATAVDTFTGPIESVTANEGRAGVFLVVGILAALWSASAYVGAFMRASNVMWEVDEGRKFVKLRPLQMLVTLMMILLLALGALAVVVTGPLAQAVGNAIGIGDTAVTVWDIAKWPVLVAIVMLMLAVLYYAAPNAKVPGFKWISLGSAVAVGIWLVASALFAFYVANFGNYDATYGSLGGVVVFLMWLWITNIAVLFGMQLNAERERDREIERGTPGADRELRIEERDPAEEKKRPSTA